MKNMMSKIKKLTAGVLAVGMLIAGIVVAPKQADATDTVTIPTAVVYEEKTNAKDLWSTVPKTAPEKDGYVFGGWFKQVQESEKTNRTETFNDNGTVTYYEPLTEVTGSAYAKFVPAQVLSVKAQNGIDPTQSDLEKLDETTATKIDESNPVWIRVISSLDSANYEKWGFDIYLANKTKVEKTGGGECVTTKKYEGLLQGDASNTTQETDAGDIFGQTSNYVFVWQLSKINHASNVSKIIYVRPYWHTMDGTKVLGLAKYVHIEDEYLDYISVPVNLQSTKDIAAGTLNMTYDYEGLELISADENKYFEAGRILPEMKVNHNATNKTLSMVGNATEVDEYNNTETIYANIRFKKPTTATTLNFDMTLGEFCDWKEDKVGNENVKVWDIAYEIE